MKEVDLFVIGAGSGGVRAARLAAAMGKTVVVAEQEFLGGTCVNVGCVPKKLLYYGAHFPDDFALATSFGWNLEGQAFSWATLKSNKDREIKRLNQVYKNLLENAGVILVNGAARFVDNHIVEVDGNRYVAKHILVATGSRSFIPDIPGNEHIINSKDVFYLESLPRKIIIVGGGYIAVEFASIFNGLGVETELDYRGELFLRGFDNEIRAAVADEMANKGITMRFNSHISSLHQLESNQKKVVYHDGSMRVVDEVLYATGRVPYTEHLSLENTQVETAENGAIRVSDNFQTSVPSIYAIGDVIDRMQLTPVALAEANVFVKNLYSKKPENMDYEGIPTAVFSNPNIATVGLTEEQARERYENIEIFRSRFTPMIHSLARTKEKTFMKMIVHKNSDRVLGVHMVGSDAGEIIQGIAIALKAGATKQVFDSTIGIHPTSAEEFVTMRQPG